MKLRSKNVKTSELWFSRSAGEGHIESGRSGPSKAKGISDRHNYVTAASQLGGEPNISPQRIEYLQEQMKANSHRDLHLWLTTILVILVLAAGFAGVLAPSLVWKGVSLHLDFKYFPQLFWGMITLIALFSIYVAAQKREVNVTRRALIRELIVGEHLQAFSLLDPVTQLLNPCAIENIAARERARANRLGFALSFAAINLDNFDSIQKHLGSERGDQVLFHAAQLLKNTFRGSDAIFRNGLHDFLVIMPDTSEQQAESAVSRLKSTAERWNADSETEFEFSFSVGIAPHVPGANNSDVIERARRCMFLSSQKVNLAF
jgi:diguanylate cyclase (GGDEF)-like protein